MPLLPDELTRKLTAVHTIVFDVDGVLTDGRLYLSSSGEETKAFHIRDGLGIVMAQQFGLRIAFMSGRISAAVERRAKELGLPEECVIGSARDKAVSLREFKRQFALPTESVAFVGDDLNDLPAFGEAGLNVAVGNAASFLLEAADYVTEASGGEGAAREMIEAVLKAQHRWDDAVSAYLAFLQGAAAGAASSPQ
jgi:3-deoxy-D-manno-octulosonate 8-phosphate phosphatase (KDO 8-P phosphatase)